MLNLRRLFDWVRAVFVRMPRYERRILVGTLIVVTFAGAMVSLVTLSTAVRRVEQRVETKRWQTAELVESAGKYLTRSHEWTRLAADGGNLVPKLEEAAREAGVELVAMSPTTTPTGSRVSLQVRNLSADRLQAFLEQLRAIPGLVVIDK